MGQVAVRSNVAKSICIYRGSEDCPRTVVVQQMNKPGIGVHTVIEALFLCCDPELLDNANLIVDNAGNFTGILSEGIIIGQTVMHFLNGKFPNTSQIVLRKVRRSIYARAIYFDVTAQLPEDGFFIINTEDF